MRHLQRTREYMITYRKSDQLEVIRYSDFDFAGCQDNRRSTLGYIYLMAGKTISQKNAKQTLVVSLTMAGKFIVCFEASNQRIGLQNFVIGLRIMDGIEKQLKLFSDNKSKVSYSNKNRSSKKAKCIDIKFLIFKERVQSGHITREHIGTNSMIADLFNIELPPMVFHEYHAHMGVAPLDYMLVQ